MHFPKYWEPGKHGEQYGPKPRLFIEFCLPADVLARHENIDVPWTVPQSPHWQHLSFSVTLVVKRGPVPFPLRPQSMGHMVVCFFDLPKRMTRRVSTWILTVEREGYMFNWLVPSSPKTTGEEVGQGSEHSSNYSHPPEALWVSLRAVLRVDCLEMKTCESNHQWNSAESGFSASSVISWKSLGKNAFSLSLHYTRMMDLTPHLMDGATINQDLLAHITLAEWRPL